ncbi:MAG: acetate--CoA ligase family protein [Pseudomonadota bacterium]
MNQAALDALLRPGAIAIVGASDDPARIGGRPLAYSLAAGFTGALYPVNPNRAVVQGLPAFASIADVPGAVDLAVIAVPASEVTAALEAVAAKGAKAAVVFSAGFAETGPEGRARQEALLARARELGVRLLGPNCVGLFNARIGHIATFSSGPEAGLSPEGRVGLVSQSGAYGTHLLAQARARRIGIGQWVSTGNEADIAVADIIHAFAMDPDVDVIAAYLEGVTDGQALLRALACATAQRKPVILIKVGRSEAGIRAVAAHTAALTGEDAVFDAAIRDLGVVRVDTTDAMFDLVYAASRLPIPKDNGIGVLTISGGAGVMMADAAEAGGLTLPPMPAAAQERLLRRNPMAAPANPVDITAQAINDFTMVSDFLGEMMMAEEYSAFVAFFTSWAGSKTLAAPLRQAILAGCRARNGRPMILVALAGEAVIADYEAQGFAVFDDPSRAVTALAGLAEIGRNFAGPRQGAPIDLATVPAFPARALNEAEGKQLLARIGLRTLPERIATDRADAEAAAAEFGTALALKILSPDIAHKTELGGVRLGIHGPQAAGDAFDAIMANVRRLAPDARLDGVSIVPMAGTGVELIIAVRHDPSFGPVTLVGAGGVLVEMFEDVAMRVGAVSIEQARAMIESLRSAALLRGIRGAPPLDIAAAAEALACLSSYGAACAATLGTIEVNPLLVREKGAVALDALILPRGGAHGEAA